MKKWNSSFQQQGGQHEDVADGVVSGMENSQKTKSIPTLVPLIFVQKNTKGNK